MAQKNGTYKVYNGSTFDEIMLKTSEDQVVQKEPSLNRVAWESAFTDSYPNENWFSHYYKKNGFVYLNIYSKVISGELLTGSKLLAVLPVGFRPKYSVISSMVNETNVPAGTLEIGTNGYIVAVIAAGQANEFKGQIIFYAGGGTV